ncbi:MAG TPA: methyl-accepting chemotaxis protein [Polyangiaceae bacterium LLY-WYZ-14_1]|nr:methyl-accepting chemotaxis protein [Polyangiaceae bacterium LLY-WYZ-14_1]
MQSDDEAEGGHGHGEKSRRGATPPGGGRPPKVRSAKARPTKASGSGKTRGSRKTRGALGRGYEARTPTTPVAAYVAKGGPASDPRDPESEPPRAPGVLDHQVLFSMLENAPTNVMFADRECVIRYANPASLRTLRDLEAHLPIAVDDLVGSSIDVFHRNPAHQRRMLADPGNLPHRTNIRLGPETLDLLVTAVMADDGAHLGSMLTWQVLTEKVRLEREVADSNGNAKATSAVLQALATAKTEDDAARQALAALCQAFGWAYGAYWREEEAGRGTFALAQELAGAGAELSRIGHATQYRLGQGLVGRVASSRDLVVVDQLADVLDGPRHRAAVDAGMNAALGLPVVVDGEVVGVIEVLLDHAESLSRERQHTLRNIARLVADAVTRLRLEERDRRKAEQAQQRVRSMLEVVRAAAKGDLTGRLDAGGDDALAMMATGLDELLTDLRGSIGEIAKAATSVRGSSDEQLRIAQTMAANAEETSQQANVVSSAAEQVSDNVQTVASGIQELNASIREIAKNASEAARVASDAVSEAQATNQTVTKLGQSSAEIGKVVNVITSIAQQTNLLALNATIEAARAGDAGKGFAVVANEVKELAKETAKATNDISQKIEAIQSDTGGAVAAIARISKIITQISDIQGTIAGAVEEQTATTSEIGRNVSDAARSSSEIAENITGVADAARSTAEGATETQVSARELGDLAETLAKLVSRFSI